MWLRLRAQEKIFGSRRTHALKKKFVRRSPEQPTRSDVADVAADPDAHGS